MTKKLPPKTYNNFLALTASGDALVRVVDVGKNLGVLPGADAKYSRMNQVELEFAQLADPVSTRPILRSGNGDDRSILTDKTGNVLNRPKVAYTPLAIQKSVTTNPPQTDYYDAVNAAKTRPVSLDVDRGKPKNTEFTKKRPCDVLDTKFRFVPFTQNSVVLGISVIGYVYDDSKVHKKGDRYSWEFNAGSNSGFWIGNNGGGARHIPSDTLKAKINNPGAIPRGGNSELLRGFHADALTALFCLSPLIGDRLTLLSTYIKELAVNNPARVARNDMFEIPVVPLVVMDGRGLHQEYTEAEILADLTDAAAPHAPVAIRAKRLDEICRSLNISKVAGGGIIMTPII